LKETYGDRVHFITVYVIEPHPNGSRSPYNKGGTGWQEWWAYPYLASIDTGPTQDPLFQPRTYKERVAQARSMMRQLGVTTPVLIDEMDNPVWVTYGKMPNCAYLIGQNGTVIERESWYQPAQLESAIKTHLGIE
jgi:hypothetical protein